MFRLPFCRYRFERNWGFGERPCFYTARKRRSKCASISSARPRNCIVGKRFLDPKFLIHTSYFTSIFTYCQVLKKSDLKHSIKSYRGSMRWNVDAFSKKIMQRRPYLYACCQFKQHIACVRISLLHVFKNYASF